MPLTIQSYVTSIVSAGSDWIRPGAADPNDMIGPPDAKLANVYLYNDRAPTSIVGQFNLVPRVNDSAVLSFDMHLKLQRLMDYDTTPLDDVTWHIKLTLDNGTGATATKSLVYSWDPDAEWPGDIHVRDFDLHFDLGDFSGGPITQATAQTARVEIWSDQFTNRSTFLFIAVDSVLLTENVADPLGSSITKTVYDAERNKIYITWDRATTFVGPANKCGVSGLYDDRYAAISLASGSGTTNWVLNTQFSSTVAADAPFIIDVLGGIGVDGSANPSLAYPNQTISHLYAELLQVNERGYGTKTVTIPARVNSTTPGVAYIKFAAIGLFGTTIKLSNTAISNAHQVSFFEQDGDTNAIVAEYSVPATSQTYEFYSIDSSYFGKTIVLAVYNTTGTSKQLTVDVFGDLRPVVTHARTNINTTTTTGLVITPPSEWANIYPLYDGETYDKLLITNITNGKLYKHDGVTRINENTQITLAEGAAGLKFTPDTDFYGVARFDVTGISSVKGYASQTETAIIRVKPSVPYQTIAATTWEFREVSIAASDNSKFDLNLFKLPGVIPQIAMSERWSNWAIDGFERFTITEVTPEQVGANWEAAIYYTFEHLIANDFWPSWKKKEWAIEIHVAPDVMSPSADLLGIHGLGTEFQTNLYGFFRPTTATKTARSFAEYAAIRNAVANSSRLAALGVEKQPVMIFYDDENFGTGPSTLFRFPENDGGAQYARLKPAYDPYSETNREWMQENHYAYNLIFGKSLKQLEDEVLYDASHNYALDNENIQIRAAAVNWSESNAPRETEVQVMDALQVWSEYTTHELVRGAPARSVFPGVRIGNFLMPITGDKTNPIVRGPWYYRWQGRIKQAYGSWAGTQGTSFDTYFPTFYGGPMIYFFWSNESDPNVIPGYTYESVTRPGLSLPNRNITPEQWAAFTGDDISALTTNFDKRMFMMAPVADKLAESCFAAYPNGECCICWDLGSITDAYPNAAERDKYAAAIRDTILAVWDRGSEIIMPWITNQSYHGMPIARTGIVSALATLDQIGPDYQVRPPVVGSVTTGVNLLSDEIYIQRHPDEGDEIKFFKIYGITNGNLYRADGVTPVQNNEFIAVSVGNAGLKFMPSGTETGTFNVQASLDNTGTGMGPASTAFIYIDPNIHVGLLDTALPVTNNTHPDITIETAKQTEKLALVKYYSRKD